MARVLITGAAGGVGRFLRAGLPALGWRLRCFDLVRPHDAEGPGEDWTVGDIRDAGALDKALDGVDAVVHLAGISLEDEFPAILANNIEGSWQLFEAARRAGVRRIVYASSNHAVGFAERGERPLPVDAPLRPDSWYGLSKVFGEGLCRLYADKLGLETVAIRIGSCFERPTTLRMLSTWLSPEDAVRLFHAALSAPLDGRLRGHATVYGVSDNTRRWWDLEPTRSLGYEPQDDSESFAAELEAAHGGPLDPADPEYRHPGGAWTEAPLPQRPAS